MIAPEDERVREAREWCAAYAAAMGPEVGEVEHDAPNHVLTLLAYIDERAAKEPDLPLAVREAAEAHERTAGNAECSYEKRKAFVAIADAVLAHVAAERTKGGAE